MESEHNANEPLPALIEAMGFLKTARDQLEKAGKPDSAAMLERHMRALAEILFVAKSAIQTLALCCHPTKEIDTIDAVARLLVLQETLEKLVGSEHLAQMKTGFEL